MTECPLTAVATARVLIWFSMKSLVTALETWPESTIIESTTMSEASGSKPRCATSIPLRPFLSSTALMLEEPTSRPTIAFDPKPNMCPPFNCRRPRRLVCALRRPGGRSRLGFFLTSGLHLAGFLFHPLVEPRLFEAPAVPQFEGGELLFPDVLVERVRTDSQILRSLPNIHDFTRVGHKFVPFHRMDCPVTDPPTGQMGENRPNKRPSSQFEWLEHISGGNLPRSGPNSEFFRVLCLFVGNPREPNCRHCLDIVVK